jgi:DNA-directed RNA polymerase subunit RPC12/RpoP
MAAMKCPDCGSQRFYVKDPEDQYNIFEFELKEGRIVSSDKKIESDPLEIMEETETYCELCAWHDRFKTLKR